MSKKVVQKTREIGQKNNRKVIEKNELKVAKKIVERVIENELKEVEIEVKNVMHLPPTYKMNRSIEFLKFTDCVKLLPKIIFIDICVDF